MPEDDTLESRLRQKLEAEEITQAEYDELYRKFEKLGILSSSEGDRRKESTFSKTGSSRIKGGKIDGPVNLLGRSVVDGSLECARLSISGSTRINGGLTVLGITSVSGELTVEGIAKFIKKIAVSGAIEVEENMYSLQTASLTGKCQIGGDLVSEGKCLISGKLFATNLRSTNAIRVEGKINIEENIIADSFECDWGDINIGGSIKANKISVFQKLHTYQSQSGSQPSEPLESIGDLVSNVVNVIFPTLINTFTGILDTKPTKLIVAGDLEAREIDISHCTVLGNVTGDDVIIGPEVTINGKLRYRNTISLPPEFQYEIEKI